MDATFSNYRKRLLPALFALSAGLVLPCSSWSAESDSSSGRTAESTVSFVTPVAKPIAEAKLSPQPSPRHHSKTHSRPARSLPTTTPRSPSAQGDLVLVSRHQRQPSFLRSRPKAAQLATKKAAQPRQESPHHVAESGKTRRLIDAMRNRKTATLSGKRTSEDQVKVVQYQEEVDSPDPPDALLIEAHSISLRATTEADYSRIVENCTMAIRQGAQKEERLFARQLASWALNRRGQIRVDEGQQELADVDFQEALDKNPNNWRALHNRGVSFAQQGLFAEAFDDFNRVIQLNHKYAKAFVNRATLFMQAGDLQSALNDYETAADIDPEFSRAQLGIGRTRHMLGQWDEALAFFDAAVKFDSNNAEILCSRGDLLSDLGQYGKALADYARAIEVDPKFAHAYRNGSWLLATCPDAQFRDPENALLGARQALEFDYGRRHVALDTLAAALASMGQYDEAISTLNDAIELAPAESKLVYNQRLQLYRRHRPFRTEGSGNISQAVFEVSDQ